MSKLKLKQNQFFFDLRRILTNYRTLPNPPDRTNGVGMLQTKILLGFNPEGSGGRLYLVPKRLKILTHRIYNVSQILQKFWNFDLTFFIEFYKIKDL